MNELPHVNAELNYLSPMREAPYAYLCEPPPGVQRENAAYESHVVPISDGRAAGTAFELHRDGFQLVEHRSRVRHLDDENEVRRIYYPEAEALVRDLAGAREAIAFDHAIRKREASRPAFTFGREHDTLQPVGRVHCDYTERSGPRRLRELLAQRGQELGERRFCEVNLWRTVREPVLDAPLAVCASWSVAPEDLVTAELRYAARRGELYLAAYRESHRWFYFPAMGADEVLLFKGYDSPSHEGARFTLHSAFEDRGAPPDAPLRHSLELRVFALF